MASDNDVFMIPTLTATMLQRLHNIGPVDGDTEEEQRLLRAMPEVDNNRNSLQDEQHRRRE
eukprot:6467759-Amphidinium_carterae.3